MSNHQLFTILTFVLLFASVFEAQGQKKVDTLPQDNFGEYQVQSCCPQGFNFAGEYCVRCAEPAHWNPFTLKCVTCDPNEPWNPDTHVC